MVSISKQRLPDLPGLSGFPEDLMKKGKHFILIRNPFDILVTPTSFISGYYH